MIYVIIVVSMFLRLSSNVFVVVGVFDSLSISKVGFVMLFVVIVLVSYGRLVCCSGVVFVVSV